MRTNADLILQHLNMVGREREQRRTDPALAARVEALKHYQQQRFRRTYADLLAHPRYAAAARFFLEELYGPGDFSDRDEQFARIVPAVVKLFPERIVSTVTTLAELHALSERLDTRMGEHLPAEQVDALAYVTAWQAVAHREGREMQVTLTLKVGRALDDYARMPMLRTTLRMMRGPAQAAGLNLLQRFLENGFDTFKAMRGASEFLGTIERREMSLIDALFSGDAVTQVTTWTQAAAPDGANSRQGDSALVQLP